MEDWKTGDERVVVGGAVVVVGVGLVVGVEVVVMVVDNVDVDASVVVMAAADVVGVGPDSGWSNSNTRPVTPMTAAIRSSRVRFSCPGPPS